MENRGKPPELSVIVPVLNEEQTLPSLLATLGGQAGIGFELILCDGGSTDLTPQLGRQAAADQSYPIRFLRTPPGRARQMNAGAASAAADTLLFLHADSRFASPDALAGGLSAWRAGQRQAGPGPLAGHFRLVFEGPGAAHGAYYFYACKAQSGRPGTIHGDQGFLLAAASFPRPGRVPRGPAAARGHPPGRSYRGGGRLAAAAGGNKDLDATVSAGGARCPAGSQCAGHEFCRHRLGRLFPGGPRPLPATGGGRPPGIWGRSSS